LLLKKVHDVKLKTNRRTGSFLSDATTRESLNG